jgi:arylsulfatase A-like enzyme
MEGRISSPTTGERTRHFPHQRFRPQSAHLARDHARPSAIYLTMCWFGLVAGLLELGLVAAQRELAVQISLDSLRTNRHFPWMIPAADLAIFALCGAILALLARGRLGLARFLWAHVRSSPVGWVKPTSFARSGRFHPPYESQRRLLIHRLGHFLGAGLMALSVLLAVEWLHPLGAAVLSCAFALKSAAWLKHRAAAFAVAVRATLPAMGAVPVILAGLVFYSESTSERRTWSGLPARPPGAPNVLFIVLDNVRADSMSLYGHERPTTPRLAELARDGIRFDSARSTASWTLPSHASMFTGQWPHRLSVGCTRGLDDAYPTLAEFLSGNGYATAGFVANTYYCNARYGLDRGFACYEDFYENQEVSLFETLRSTSLGKCLLRVLGYSMRFAPGDADSRKTAAMINRDALAWIATRPADRPFFVFLNYYDAHSPFIPPPEATRRFGLCALPRGEQVNILKQSEQAILGRTDLGDLERARINDRANSVRQDGYESSIAYLDEQLGRLFDELRGRGLLENTLVILTSDHGEHFQERGFSGHGMSVYRREIHVPLLIFPPRGSTDRRIVAEPVSLRDLPATVADLLGLGTSSPFPGRSLARFFRPVTAGGPPVDPVLSEVGHQSHMPPNPGIPATLGTIRALTTEDAVYIHHSHGREELYDRSDDPFETRNRLESEKDSPLIRQHREILSLLLGDQDG